MVRQGENENFLRIFCKRAVMGVNVNGKGFASFSHQSIPDISEITVFVLPSFFRKFH